jgi:hypothetical protein
MMGKLTESDTVEHQKIKKHIMAEGVTAKFQEPLRSRAEKLATS